MVLLLVLLVLLLLLLLLLSPVCLWIPHSTGSIDDSCAAAAIAAVCRHHGTKALQGLGPACGRCVAQRCRQPR